MLAMAVCFGFALGSGPRSAFADEPVSRQDHFVLTARSDTYVEFFRRALLPGPGGTLVETRTIVPVQESFVLRAGELDTPWNRDSVDVELGGWSNVQLRERPDDRGIDGDIQVANVGYRQGPMRLRLGRQHAAGSAARYVRFDGVSLGATLGTTGIEVGGYGGFTVLPRWDAKPGYYHLGSAADSLLREPDALPEPERSGYRLAGGRIGWASTQGQAGISVHEQHEPEGLSRRTLGLDGRVLALPNTAIGASGLVELDAAAIQDARIWVDASPATPLDISLELLHTEPALFLSRQSILSAFSTDAYEEGGGLVVLRLAERFAVEGGGYVELYDRNDRGARGQVGVRLLPGQRGAATGRAGYERVVAPDNGYHAARVAFATPLIASLSATLEVFGYYYDASIRSQRTSAVCAGTLSYHPNEVLSLLWGTSWARSPYAALDAQTLLRASIDLDFSSEGSKR